MKALLIILSKRSLIECRQCWESEKKKKQKKKQHEDAAQKGKNQNE